MIGRVLSSRYELREVVGTGGMSVVYRAYDMQNGREVAVKVLRSEFMQDQEFVKRFDREAQAASKMSHPHIVNLLGVGEDGEIRYLVMEFIKGHTLKDVIRELKRIQPKRAVSMAIRILAAVDHAHKNHIVHRDIKPQNILVDAHNNIKVADFGIARATNTSTMTLDDSIILGSVHYFSPEQADGRGADEKSDLYSVGVVLYEMLTGHVPFEGDSPVSVALKHIREAPPLPRRYSQEISPALEQVLMRALEKDPSLRYQSAAEMAVDLKTAVQSPEGGFVRYPRPVDADEDEDEGEEAAALTPRQMRADRRRRVWTGIFITLIIAFCVWGAIWYGRNVISSMFSRVHTPDLAYITQEKAMEELEALGLYGIAAERHNSQVQKGLVIDQQPIAGTLVAQGSKVRFTVSLGKDQVLMPRVTDVSRDEAVHLIEDNDLVLGEVSLVVSEQRPGTVVGQRPEANEWIAPGTAVNLIVSGESTEVPNIVGEDEQSVGSLVSVYGFELGKVTEVPSTDMVGKVISQSVQPGVMALVGTKIDVEVGVEIPQKYREMVEVTFTVPDSATTVRIDLVEDNATRYQVYTSEGLKKGTHTVPLNLSSTKKGEQKIVIYFNGVYVEEQTIVFETLDDAP